MESKAALELVEYQHIEEPSGSGVEKLTRRLDHMVPDGK